MIPRFPSFGVGFPEDPPHKRPNLLFMTRNGKVALPKGSNVVPYWVCYGFLLRDYNILPKKELHRRVWVVSFVLVRVFRGVKVEHWRDVVAKHRL